MPALFLIDDKWVPLYRVVWVAQLPHFCGSEECEREGQYEVRLDNGESVWADDPRQRDEMVEALRQWLAESDT